MQPDYAALLEKSGRGSAIAAAQQQRSQAEASFHLAHDRRVLARAKQERCAVRIQCTFRGWRQRMYNQVNALKYDILQRRERAIAKAWQKARQLVTDKVVSPAVISPAIIIHLLYQGSEVSLCI